MFWGVNNKKARTNQRKSTHIRVQRCAHQYEREIISSEGKVPEDDDQEVRVHGPLVHLFGRFRFQKNDVQYDFPNGVYVSETVSDSDSATYRYDFQEMLTFTTCSDTENDADSDSDYSNDGESGKGSDANPFRLVRAVIDSMYTRRPSVNEVRRCQPVIRPCWSGQECGWRKAASETNEIGKTDWKIYPPSSTSNQPHSHPHYKPPTRHPPMYNLTPSSPPLPPPLPSPHLIQDDMRHPFELGVCLQPPEQDAGRDEQQLGVLASASLQPNLVAYRPPHRFAALRRHSLSDA